MSSNTPAELLMRGPLIGAFLGMLLYGVTCMQTFFYFQNYPDDRFIFKAIVASLWSMESAHVSLAIYAMDHYLIVNFSDVDALQTIEWNIPAIFTIGFVIDFVVNSYFIWRVQRLSNKIILPLLMMMFNLARLGIGLYSCVLLAIDHSSWNAFRDACYPILVAGTTMIVVGDASTACILAYYLRKGRSEHSSSMMTGLIDRLLIYTIGTGGLTSIVELATMLAMLLSSDSLSFMGITIVQTGLYANSLLTSLNIRKYHSKLLEESSRNGIRLTTLSFDARHTAGRQETTQQVRGRHSGAEKLVTPSTISASIHDDQDMGHIRFAQKSMESVDDMGMAS
ncbi:hypothetical protein SERLADRAFT_380526 [Serpula lacrymans var. lacrymans S7.9]|uniref:DUF6534 domain-containing protein n=1 Tax=Serpula lacrymans var. lacrymans (strain S7.9) TaxID=578457 RepID=F8NLR0_SERL9|nr:uncharacterized protein SERLADRAFT_380526 [Serpula lacrymans var. lacrymans S7.9]EGO28612.1 hypothetical protein SERLADRAFT_380526 [Serpula lacrymans var. lacrymans S7.9]